MILKSHVIFQECNCSINGQSEDDLIAHKPILNGFLVIAFHFGYNTGFDAIQLAIFMSIYLQSLKEIICKYFVYIATVRKDSSFLDTSLPDLFKTQFFNFLELQEYHIKQPESKFTSNQCRDIISFMTSE